jgi:hypothetical protein
VAELAQRGVPVKAGDQGEGTLLLGGAHDERDDQPAQGDRPRERVDVIVIELADVGGQPDALERHRHRAVVLAHVGPPRSWWLRIRRPVRRIAR